MIERKFSILILALCLPTFLLGADDSRSQRGNTNFSGRFEKKWSSRPLKIRQQILSRNISGSFPGSSAVAKSAERFYKALEYLPPDLIRKSGLKYVTFLRNLKLNGQPAGGAAGGNTIYLPPDFEEKTVFHEFFHIFDPQRKNDQWNKINPPGFRYTGNQFYAEKFSKKEKRQIRKNVRKDDVKDAFVSSYAMSAEGEDRAETFAHMIVEGKRFLKRTRNPVMKMKMEFIMELFIQRDLLNKQFWEQHFDGKFNSKKRYYSESSANNK